MTQIHRNKPLCRRDAGAPVHAYPGSVSKDVSAQLIPGGSAPPGSLFSHAADQKLEELKHRRDMAPRGLRRAWEKRTRDHVTDMLRKGL